MPDKVTRSQWVLGEESALNSILKVKYNDESEWHFRVVEISGLHHFITIELISAEPKVQVEGMLMCISLWAVTKSNFTFLKWKTDFSNDVTPDIVADHKYKKLDAFDSWSKYILANHDCKIRKSPMDKRLYRHLTLPNQMNVILISDP